MNMESARTPPTPNPTPMEGNRERMPQNPLEGATDDELDAAVGSFESGEHAIDIEGAMNEAVEESAAKQEQEDAERQEVSSDVDKAFEGLTERSSADAVTQAELGGETAAAIQKAFETKDLESLKGLIEDFKGKGGDIAVLREQLKGFHDAYRAAGLDEKASEIDAFSRSLDAKAEVSSEAGTRFMADLQAGKFSNVEEANTALDGLKDAAKIDEAALRAEGKSEAEIKRIKEDRFAEINDEFNVLFRAVTEHFGSQNSEKLGFEEDEIGDDFFANLG